jgi:hypothetical protein
MTNQKCVWHEEDVCDGEVESVALFDQQLRADICPKHLRFHRIIVALGKHGLDVEEILRQTQEWREQEAARLGINVDDPSL